MAHFAKLDAYNNVIEVHVVSNDACTDYAICQESEAKGIEFLTNWSGGYALWKQTSYNGNIRKNFAGIGFKYDPQRDAFIPPKPFASWLLNEDTCQWYAPEQYPNDGGRYQWDETSLAWIALT
jgi:hypothetical protein